MKELLLCDLDREAGCITSVCVNFNLKLTAIAQAAGISGKIAQITISAAANATGSATTRVLKNVIDNKNVTDNLAESTTVGFVSGTISGTMTKYVKPSIPTYEVNNVDPRLVNGVTEILKDTTKEATFKGQVAKELFLGARDAVIQQGVDKSIDTIKDMKKP